MTNIFQTTKLAGHRVLVTDGVAGGNSAILDSTQWDHYNLDKKGAEAEAMYDAAVKEFYAPLIAATEAVEATFAPKIDSAFYIVEAEATEGVMAVPAQLVELTYESAILRMIDSGDTGRLIWVNGSIEILEASEDSAIVVDENTVDSIVSE